MISKKEGARAVHSRSLFLWALLSFQIYPSKVQSVVGQSLGVQVCGVALGNVRRASKRGWGRFSPLQKFSLLPLLIRLSTHLNRRSTKAKGSVGCVETQISRNYLLPKRKPEMRFPSPKEPRTQTAITSSDVALCIDPPSTAHNCSS